MEILVTGGSGLVGTALQKIMPRAEYISSSDFDLTFRNDVEWMFQKYRPTHVIHLAARVGGIMDNIKNPVDFYEKNVLINTLVLKYSHMYGVERFVGVLSSCAYPDTSNSYPLTEGMLFDGPPPKTNFAYAIAKRGLATQIMAYNEQYKKRYSYVIPCNVYGEEEGYRDGKSHFIAALIKKVSDAYHNNKVVELLGDGTPLRQHLYVNDFASILKQVIDNDITESFNIAPDENLSIMEIAHMLANEVGVFVRFDPSLPSGQYRKDIDNTRLKGLFPQFEFTPLQEGLIKCYTYYEKNRTY